jgi:hypothetical protein
MASSSSKVDVIDLASCPQIDLLKSLEQLCLEVRLRQPGTTGGAKRLGETPAGVRGWTPFREDRVAQSVNSSLDAARTIFRAWKYDSSGRKMWARDYGLRAWPIRVPAWWKDDAD